MTKAEIEEVIREEINPSLQAHGGHVTLESFDENTKNIQISLGGGCQGCAMSRITLRSGIENHLRDEFPDLGDVEDVTDHLAGENPYYEKD